MTYRIDGKQYAVTPSGGHGRMHTKFDEKTRAALGDALVVCALPK